jgi:cbb3-type cytochrome oxidase maturation protein
LIPFSTALVLVILGVFGWAVFRGQFDDLEREGTRILGDEARRVDSDQAPPETAAEQSSTVHPKR